MGRHSTGGKCQNLSHPQNRGEEGEGGGMGNENENETRIKEKRQSELQCGRGPLSRNTGIISSN